MEYTVNILANMAGVSARTLRYYDEIGLLKPKRINSNGYRIYGKDQVDNLQQILFYRELGVNLEEIKCIITEPGFDRAKSLEHHLTTLTQKKKQIEMLIENVSKTIDSLKGAAIMSDRDKFEGFKDQIIQDNEKKYGEEIRRKYGDKEVEESNARIKGMTEEQWKQQEELSTQIEKLLKQGVQSGNPAGEIGKKLCEAHAKWLCMFWPKGKYTKEMHRNMGDMYVCDERFKAFYDDIVEGGAQFLFDALKSANN